MYDYRVGIFKVVDGDTFHGVWDLGGDTYHIDTFRAYGINAPEMSTPEGVVAKVYLEQLIINHALMWRPDATDFPVFSENVVWMNMTTYTDKKEKYGRYLYTLWAADMSINLNDAMVQSGNAVVYLP